MYVRRSFEVSFEQLFLLQIELDANIQDQNAKQTRKSTFPRVDLYLIFEKSSSTNWIFSLQKFRN